VDVGRRVAEGVRLRELVPEGVEGPPDDRAVGLGRHDAVPGLVVFEDAHTADPVAHDLLASSDVVGVLHDVAERVRHPEQPALVVVFAAHGLHATRVVDGEQPVLAVVGVGGGLLLAVGAGLQVAAGVVGVGHDAAGGTGGGGGARGHSRRGGHHTA